MAKSIATVYGTAIKPGVSRNGRLYTAEHIQDAVSRIQGKIMEGTATIRDLRDNPLTQRTHHAADDDSTKIVGRLTSLSLDPDGSAKYTAELANTEQARTILELIDTSDGQPAFLKGVSIRGRWVGDVKNISHDGKMVETADGLDIFGLDYTQTPGVPGAGIDKVVRHDKDTPQESDFDGFIFESVQEALVTNVVEAASPTLATESNTETAVEEKGAPPLKSGKAAASQTKATSYADPGYQGDKAKRYALDTKQQAKAAWSYINMPKNAKLYTANQLKRVKERIMKALKAFGVQVDAKENLIIDTFYIKESGIAYEGGLEENYGYDNGSFCVELTNGPVSLRISSYCIDPADLDVIGKAAMDAACMALKMLDPDMDGDIDVPGAPSEDNDNDMESAKETIPDASVTVTETEDPAPEPAAAQENKEDDIVTDAPTPAVESTTDTAPNPLDALNAKFDGLTAAITSMVEKLATAPVETAPAAPVTETVQETDEQRIQRLVAEGVAKAMPTAIAEHVEKNGVQRKGLVPTLEAAEAAIDGTGKALHEMSKDEFSKLGSAALLGYVGGARTQGF